MTTRVVQGVLGGLDTFAWSNGYADGKRDAAAGMLLYVDAALCGAEYVAGYDAGAICLKEISSNP